MSPAEPDTPAGPGFGPTADPGKQARAASGIPIVGVLDGVRALGVGMVATFHLLGAAGVFTVAGGNWGGQIIYGVLPQALPALFIVSGFVMFLPVAARDGRFGSVRAYALRRSARLIPAYYLSLAIALGILLALKPSENVLLPDLSHIVFHLTLIHVPVTMIDESSLIGFVINGPVWTLSNEAIFYALLPVIAVPFYRRPWIGLAIGVALFAIWCIPGIAESIPTWVNQFPYWAVCFAVGMLAALTYVRISRSAPAERLARPALAVTVVSLVVLAVLGRQAGVAAFDLPFPGPFDIARLGYPEVALQLSISLMIGVGIVALALSPRWLRAPFDNPLARWLGDISYGVYLVHFMLLFPMSLKLGLPTDGTIGAVGAWFGIVVPVSILYGWLSFRFIETPIRARAQARARAMR